MVNALHAPHFKVFFGGLFGFFVCGVFAEFCVVFLALEGIWILLLVFIGIVNIAGFLTP